MRYVLLLAVTFSLFVSSAAPRAQAPFQTHRNEAAGVIFRYPNGWQSVEPLSTAQFLNLVSADGRSDCLFWLNTDVPPLNPDASPEQLKSGLGDYFRDTTVNYRADHAEVRKVGDVDVLLVSFRAEVRAASGPVPAAGRMVIKAWQGRAVSVICMAPERATREMLQAFDLISGSMTFLPVANAAPQAPRVSDQFLGMWAGRWESALTPRRGPIELNITSATEDEVMGAGMVGGTCGARLAFRGKIKDGALVIEEDLGPPCGLTTLTLKPEGNALRGTYREPTGAGDVVLTRQ